MLLAQKIWYLISGLKMDKTADSLRKLYGRKLSVEFVF